MSTKTPIPAKNSRVLYWMTMFLKPLGNSYNRPKFHVNSIFQSKMRKVFHSEAFAQVFCKKAVLKNFTKFTGKHLRQSLLLKKIFWHMCFPVNFGKFLRTPLLTEHLWWLLLFIAAPSFLQVNWSSEEAKYNRIKLLYTILILQVGLWLPIFELANKQFWIKNIKQNSFKENYSKIYLFREIFKKVNTKG